jgi:hypothetical protein
MNELLAQAMALIQDMTTEDDKHRMEHDGVGVFGYLWKAQMDTLLAKYDEANRAVEVTLQWPGDAWVRMPQARRWMYTKRAAYFNHVRDVVRLSIDAKLYARYIRLLGEAERHSHDQD